MRVATWNINSIRARVDKVVNWLIENKIDVLLMQETKCKNDQFPALQFETAGYKIAYHGINQWNGVAIAALKPLKNIKTEFQGQPSFNKENSAKPIIEPRYISAQCAGLTFTSIYVPNGRELTDAHYAYKLNWLQALNNQIKTQLNQTPNLALIIGGDWNIAPLDNDVWDINYFQNKTHVSPPERKAFQAFLKLGLVDPVRPFTSTPKTYTYWDYTQLRFPKNEGMRIDFLLCTANLATKVQHGHIDKKTRYGKGASDHVPVIIDIDNNTQLT